MKKWPFHIRSQMSDPYQCLFMGHKKRNRNSPKKGGLVVFLTLHTLVDNHVCEVR